MLLQVNEVCHTARCKLRFFCSKDDKELESKYIENFGKYDYETITSTSQTDQHSFLKKNKIIDALHSDNQNDSESNKSISPNASYLAAQFHLQVNIRNSITIITRADTPKERK